MGSVNSTEHDEMKEWFGGGNRLANALTRSGIGSMAQADELYTQLGSEDFALKLWCIPNIGEGSVAQILSGIQKYQADKAPGKTGRSITSQPYDVWTRNDSPEWLARNAGCSDVRLLAGLDWSAALSLGLRLREKYGDENVQIHPSNNPPKPGTVGSYGPGEEA